MTETEPIESDVQPNPYDTMSVLNATQLEYLRKERIKERKSDDYVLPADSRILVTGRLKDERITSVDLGFLTLDEDVVVKSLGSGSSTKEGLVGEHLGFFELNLDNIPDEVEINKTKASTKRKGRSAISMVEKFYWKHHSYEDLEVIGHDDEIGILVFTVKLHGNLNLR